MENTNKEELYPGTEAAEPEASPAPSPEEIAISVQKRFDALREQSDGSYRLEENPDGSITFTLICEDKAEAVDLAERFAMVHAMRPMMANAFREGMIDGIRQYRKLIAEKNASLFSKALDIGDRMIAYIQRQPKASNQT